MKGLLFIALQSICFASTCQTLIDSNSHFLEMDVNSKHVVYFKFNSDEPDEYREGNVYLYDIEHKSSSLLNKNTYILNFLNVEWTRNGKYFFLSDGMQLTVFSFKENQTRVLYEAAKGNFINNLRISNSGRYAVFNVKKNEGGKITQAVYRFDWASDRCEEIYSIDDNSVGEALKNESFITDSGDAFILDLNKRFFEIGLDKSVKTIEQMAKEIHYVEDNNLYYSVIGALVQLDRKTLKKFKIFESRTLRVNYVGKYKEDIVINFNDNTYVYNPGGKVVSLNLKPGRYVYIDQNLAIRQSQEGLYLHSGVKTSNK